MAFLNGSSLIWHAILTIVNDFSIRNRKPHVPPKFGLSNFVFRYLRLFFSRQCRHWWRRKRKEKKISGRRKASCQQRERRKMSSWDKKAQRRGEIRPSLEDKHNNGRRQSRPNSSHRSLSRFRKTSPRVFLSPGTKKCLKLLIALLLPVITTLIPTLWRLFLHLSSIDRSNKRIEMSHFRAIVSGMGGIKRWWSWSENPDEDRDVGKRDTICFEVRHLNSCRIVKWENGDF